MFDLHGRVALVTGAARGIGAAIAEALVDAGAKVVLADLTAEASEELAERLRTKGGEVNATGLDVRSRASCDAAVSAAVSAFGSLDILVNNAGINTRLQPGVDTGVIDQDVQRSEGRHRGTHGGVAGRPAPDIQTCGIHLAPFGAQSFRKLLARLRCEVRKHHFCAGIYKSFRDGGAYSAGCARDECNAAMQVKHIHIQSP